ncbi:hypothetical protein Gotri_024729 [Gossypium trilobum]|uniref:Uncharacterized protein n=1 Tax=Gossypium trilobum TaxID=34281 RepID=A0A7J9DNC4_9ROSI|nr:hypothetical protein [Gossypium trilobum]
MFGFGSPVLPWMPSMASVSSTNFGPSSAAPSF